MHEEANLIFFIEKSMVTLRSCKQKAKYEIWFPLAQGLQEKSFDHVDDAGRLQTKDNGHCLP